MNHLELIKELAVKNEIIEIIISSKDNKDVEYNKINIKPFLKDNEVFYQFSYVFDKKTTHENLNSLTFLKLIEKDFENFKQMVIFSAQNDFQVLKNKKGIKVIKNKASKKLGEFYIIVKKII